MSNFQSLQQQFAAYIRDPNNAPLPPGCDAARMQHYHQLFFNNFDGVLATAFPRLSANLPADDWHELTLLFFQTEPQQSPYLGDVPARFAEFLDAQTICPLTDGQMELAAYELACFELKSEQDQEIPPILPEPVAWEMVRPVLNPVSLFFESVFPVHDLAWDPLSADHELTFLVLVRDSEGRVQTHSLSPASARLLVLLGERPELSVAQIVAILAAELDQSEAILLTHVTNQIEQWLAEEVVLGAI